MGFIPPEPSPGFFQLTISDKAPIQARMLFSLSSLKNQQEAAPNDVFWTTHRTPRTPHNVIFFLPCCKGFAFFLDRAHRIFPDGKIMNSIACPFYDFEVCQRLYGAAPESKPLFGRHFHNFLRLEGWGGADGH